MMQPAPSPVMQTSPSSAPLLRGATGLGLVGRHTSSLRVAAALRAVAPGSVSVILLSGGVGKRMKASMPKQYLDLRGRPIATWSLIELAGMPEVGEVVVVCAPEYRDIFTSVTLPRDVPLVFAPPGDERQDSVLSGLRASREDATVVAVHDSARPLVLAADVRRCLVDAAEHGAAVLAVPVKPTIKEVGADGMVIKTLDRSVLWDIQTPQCIRPDLLLRGFEHVAAESLAVTDDVSIVEALGQPVKITPGDYSNIKVTTPEDMAVAQCFLDER